MMGILLMADSINIEMGPAAYHFSEMVCARCIFVLMVVLLVALTDANLNDTIYFTTTPKPLECHEIKLFDFRSSVECALYCTRDLYSCAGYVYSRNKSSHFQCELCFIYDVVAPLVTVDASDSTIVTMPDIRMETGQ